MSPSGTILERGYANHGTVELDIRAQVEPFNIRPEVIDVFR
jgi:hypothetical protein